MKKVRIAIASATVFLQCRAAEPPPVVVPPPPPPAPVDAPIATPAPPSAASRAVVFAGAGTIANAAWVASGVVAVTRTEVWRFTPDKPHLVQITPLAGALNAHEVIAATTASSLVAVALDDSSVDILDDSGHKVTLPAPPSPTDILSLRFSPDQQTIAVTRNVPWKEATTFYDVASGKELGTIEGGKVVFDPSGKYVAGRGGVSTIEGKSLFAFKEGFYVLGESGKMTPMDRAQGAEVVTADNVARGFFQGSFFYSGEKAIELFDPATGTSSSIAAACGHAKNGSEADLAQGRVVAACDDGVLITDLAKKTTRKIKVAMKERSIFPPDVLIPAGSASFMIRGSGGNIFVDPLSGTTHEATYQEITSYQASTREALCVHGRTARTAIRCDIPSARPDGAYQLNVEDGLRIKNAAGGVVVEWPTLNRHGPRTDFVFHRGAIELRRSDHRALAFRLDGAPPGPDPGEPFSADGCGKPSDKEWYLRDRSDTFAAFTETRAANGYVTAEVLCVCRADGCTKRDLPNSNRLAESLLAVSEDGTTLSMAINSTMTDTDIFVRRPKKPVLHTKIHASCIYGALGPDGRVFMSCEALERSSIWELAAKDLALVAKRNAPPIGRRIGHIQRLGDDILAHVGDADALLPVDWVKDPTQKERAFVFAASDFVISLRPDGKVAIAGDVEAAARIARCHDGTQLRPFSECRHDVLAR